MPRRTLPLRESIRGEIYDLLVSFAVANQAIPNAHSFWRNVVCEKLGYKIPWGSFQYHFMKLQIDGLVEIEPLTKAIKITGVELIPKNP